MVLVDTSVWIDHLRQPDELVNALLSQRLILTHPFVIGEISLGNFANRSRTLFDLCLLREARVVPARDVLHYIGTAPLYGTGIGYVDAHLLASARSTPAATFWTRDKRLKAVSDRLGLSMPLS